MQGDTLQPHLNKFAPAEPLPYHPPNPAWSIGLECACCQSVSFSGAPGWRKPRKAWDGHRDENSLCSEIVNVLPGPSTTGPALTCWCRPGPRRRYRALGPVPALAGRCAGPAGLESGTEAADCNERGVKAVFVWTLHIQHGVQKRAHAASLWVPSDTSQRANLTPASAVDKNSWGNSAGQTATCDSNICPRKSFSLAPNKSVHEEHSCR